MIHPHTVLRHINDEVGHGVVATRPIPAGTIVWVLDPLDQVLDAARLGALDDGYEEILEKYTYRDGNGNRILCWDIARFVNHSCEANTLSPGFSFDIAVRDIAPGEEVTADYGSLNLEREFECRCGTQTCRGAIKPGDFETYAAVWDERIRAAFPLLQNVAQPLWRRLRESDTIAAAITDPGRVPSILRHRWKVRT